MHECLFHISNIIINDMFDNSSHPLQVTYVWPTFFQPWTNLINFKLNGTVLWSVRWMANHTIAPQSHHLVHLWQLVQSEVVVYNRSPQGRIGHSIIVWFTWPMKLTYVSVVVPTSSEILAQTLDIVNNPTRSFATARSPASTTRIIVDLKVPLS